MARGALRKLEAELNEAATTTISRGEAKLQAMSKEELLALISTLQENCIKYQCEIKRLDFQGTKDRAAVANAVLLLQKQL